MTHKQIVARMKDIRDDIQRLSDRAEKDGDLTEEQEKEWSELRTEFEDLDGQRKKLEREADLERVVKIAGEPRNVEQGSDPGIIDRDIMDPDSVEDRRFKNPWDLSEMRTYGNNPAAQAQELRARALSAVEQLQGSNDKRREVMTRFLDEQDSSDGRLARQCLLTSSPAYLRAFAKAARGLEHTYTEDEKEAVSRAMSLTDSAGGYLVPFQLDPTVIITSAGSLNQIRRVARQVVATGDVWNGVSSGAVSWSWDAEAAEASDDTTTFAQPSIPVYKGVGFVPISLEALQDEANVANEVGRLLAFGKDELEATAFATGNGTSAPQGIVTGITGGSIVASATTDVFADADVYALDNALPARHRMNASWLGHRGTYNLIRQFDTGGGASLWVQLAANVPPTLLGRPAYEAEAMDGTINALADNKILVYGNFENYVIADRIGTTVEFIPHLFATANNLPSGQRGWYAYFRVGAEVVDNGSFRILNVT